MKKTLLATYSALDRRIAAWADEMLQQVEKELASGKPTERAMLALEINDMLRCGIERFQRFPSIDPMLIFSYRSGDAWKYQFAAPMLITRAAAEVLFSGISCRTKAVKLIEGFKNAQTVIVHGEHAVPTSEQRANICRWLIQKQSAGALRVSEFPNTYLARELLIINIIVAMHANESTHLTVSDLVDANDVWSRYHSIEGHDDIKPFMISRKWIQQLKSKNKKNNGQEDFRAFPELLDKIAALIKKQNPSTFEEFWNMLIEQ